MHTLLSFFKYFYRTNNSQTQNAIQDKDKSAPATQDATQELKSKVEISSKEREDQNTLHHQIRLKPSQSSTNIEFNEVFTIPISKYFDLLTNLAQQNLRKLVHNPEKQKVQTPSQTSKNEKDSIIENMQQINCLIDMRPYRWYKEFDYLLLDIKKTKSELDELKEIALAIQTEGMKDIPMHERHDSNSNYVSLKKELEKISKKQITLKILRDKLLENKKLLIRELKINGYYLDEKKKIFDSYEFTIYKFETEKPGSITALKDSEIEEFLKSKREWETILEALTKKLIKDGENSLLKSAEKRNEFLSKLENLRLLENFQELKIDYDRQMSEYDIAIENLRKNFDEYKGECYRGIKLQRDLLEDRKRHPNSQFHLRAIENQTEERMISDREKEIDNEMCELDKKNQDEIIKIQDKINMLKTCHPYRQRQVYLFQQRCNFIMEWNNPQNYIVTGKKGAIQVYPSTDPVIDSLKEIEIDKTKKEHQKKNLSEQKLEKDLKTNTEENFSIPINTTIYRFTLESKGFYNQDGESLEEFMQRSDLAGKIILLPYFDRNGVLSSEVSQLIVNPKKPRWPISNKPPVIKFVETQVLNVTWEGNSLGELRYSLNLFPGEKKKIVIERQTKLAQTITQSLKKPPKVTVLAL